MFFSLQYAEEKRNPKPKRKKIVQRRRRTKLEMSAKAEKHPCIRYYVDAATQTEDRVLVSLFLFLMC